MRLGIIRSAAILCAFCLLLTGCSTSQAIDGEKQRTIAVSIVPEATFAKEVCGDLAHVVTLVPPGASPESYEPAPKEMEEFGSSSVYFTIGVPVEDASVLPKAPKNMKIVRLQDAVSKAYADRKFESGGRDPHIWLSPKRAKVMTQEIAREMESIDPDNRSKYAANAAAYEKRLNDLDTKIREILSAVSNKTFLVFHPAFGYFADEYGLHMVALEQEGKESTAQHMQELVDLAKSEGAKAIFYQAESDSKQARAFAEEIGGKAVELAPLSGEYENNLIKMAQTIAGEIRSESNG